MAGTVHTIMTDCEEPGEVESQQLRWCMTAEFDHEQFTEKALSFLEAAEPQRVSVPGIAQFLGVIEVPEIIRMIDLMVDAADATHHILTVPTLIYRPGQYVLWPLVRQVNAYIRHKAAETSCPMLNLARSFVGRQQNSWVVSSMCF